MDFALLLLKCSCWNFEALSGGDEHHTFSSCPEGWNILAYGLSGVRTLSLEDTSVPQCALKVQSVMFRGL